MISQEPLGYPSQSAARAVANAGASALTGGDSQRDSPALRIQLHAKFTSDRRISLERRAQLGKTPLQLLRLRVADGEALQLNAAGSLFHGSRMRRVEPIDKKRKRETKTRECRSHPLPPEL